MIRSSLRSVLSEYIPDYSSSPSPKRAIALRVALKYLFRIMNAASFGRRMREVYPSADVKSLRLRLRRSGYHQFYLVGYLYRMHKHGDADPKAWQVFEKDAKLYDLIRSDGEFVESLDDYTAKYAAVTPTKLQRNFDRMYGELKPYLSRYVRKKMIFIVRSFGMQTEDFVNELASYGFESVMNMYPCIDSYLHALNIAKCAAKRRGVNIIKEHTTQSRQRLHRNEDGTFSSRMVPMAAVPVEELEEFNVNMRFSDIEGRPTNAGAESVLGLKLLERELGPKQKIIVVALTEHHEGFSEYLHQQGITMDNDQYVAMMAARGHCEGYMGMLFDYLRVPHVKGWRFIESLQEGLRPSL